MPEPNWYNANAHRAFPFLDADLGMPLPEAVVVDFGCMTGLRAGFEDGVHSVWLSRVLSSGGTVVFEFLSDAPGLVDYILSFQFNLSDPEFSSLYSEVTMTGAVLECEGVLSTIPQFRPNAYYRFDDDLLDSSGHGQNLSSAGSVSYAVGVLNNAIIDDGGAPPTRVSIDGMNEDTASISLWVQVPAPADGDLDLGAAHISGFYDGISAGMYLALIFGSDVDSPTVAFVPNTTLIANLSPGYHHLVVVKNGVNFKLYVDNNLEDEDPAGSADDDWHLVSFVTYINPMSAVAYPIDEMSVYNYALTSEHVDILYGNGVPYDPTAHIASSFDSSSSCRLTHPNTSSEGAMECVDDPIWEGFMVIGNLAALELADGESLEDVGHTTKVEQGLIQNLAKSFVRTINLANADRVKADAPEGCGSAAPSEDASFVNARCLIGAVKCKPGYNCSIRQDDRENSLTIGAAVGAGAGEPCVEVPLYNGEVSPDGGLLLTGGPTCNQVLKSINGVGGRVIRLFAGSGVRITPGVEEGVLLIDFDLHDLAVCGASSITV